MFSGIMLTKSKIKTPVNERSSIQQRNQPMQKSSTTASRPEDTHHFPHRKSSSARYERHPQPSSAANTLSKPTWSHAPLTARGERRKHHTVYPPLLQGFCQQLQALLRFLSWPPAQPTGFAKGSVNPAAWAGKGSKSRGADQAPLSSRFWPGSVVSPWFPPPAEAAMRGWVSPRCSPCWPRRSVPAGWRGSS